jgi:hypothetical protein
MGEVRPYDRAAKLLGATGADAGLTSRRTDGLACREPGKTTETPGSGSKRTVIWGMSAKITFPVLFGELAITLWLLIMGAKEQRPAVPAGVNP